MSKRTAATAFGGLIVVTVAAMAALLFGMFHELRSEESVLIVGAAALIAGGIAYTIRTFVKMPH